MTFDDKNTVYILDSYGLIFRCYFAFISRPLTNQNGKNVSALFGFFRNLHWIIQHYKPGYIFAAMDSKTKTFRHQMYEEYKATRNKTPEDLHAQIPWIEDILQTLGIPVLQCDGYEADDIIATVEKKCREQKRGCRILSGDKDLMQLVNETTQILKPESGASTWKITGIDGVVAEWGVMPKQLLDLLSLCGDTADNIPGVSGIGIKTASKLINDFSNLEGIYENLDKLKGATLKKLQDGQKDAFFSRELVKLCDTVDCPKIDEALNAAPLTLNTKAAAQKMMEYGIPNVAKSYAELDFSFSNNENQSKTSKKENIIPNDTNQAILEINAKQNDTSNYKAITNLEELQDYISKYIQIAEENPGIPISFDTETDSLDTLNCALVGFSLCYKEQQAVYIPIKNENQSLFSNNEGICLKDCISQLARLFTNKKVLVVMHNAKFDLKVYLSKLKTFSEIVALEQENEVASIKCALADTMIAAWLLNPERTSKNGYSLEYLSETVLGLKGIEFSELVEKGQNFSDVPLEKAYKYGAEDADFTLLLWNNLKKKFDEQDKELFLMEMQIVPILTQMEINGIHLDAQNLVEYNHELELSLINIEKEIYKTVGHEFNIASPKQLQTVLFEELKLPCGKKTKTGYSTDTSVLEELAFVNPVPKMILEYRELAKLQSTYVLPLPKMTDANERIHTDFVQTGTATGRLSCREPNLQNIPVRSLAGRKIRCAFTAPKGKVLISADYAQIELVVLAHLSKDPKMCEAFINAIDVHKATASMIYNVSKEQVTDEMRRTAKTINFGVIYGMSAFRLAKDLGISRTQASMFIENYFTMYSKINSFIQDTVLNAEESGIVKTIFGRKRPILNINSKNKIEKASAERMAVNTPVQGSAADIVKKAMISVTSGLKASKSKARLLLQVHDELIFECPDDQKIIDETVNLIKDKMENAVRLEVPLKVSIEVGKCWGDFH